MLSGQNTAYLMERGLGMLKRIPVSYTHLDVYKRQTLLRLRVQKERVTDDEGEENLSFP